MKRKIIKTGNSLAITIPAGFIKDLSAKVGDEVELKFKAVKNKMIVTFLKKSKQISLFDKK